MSDEARIWSLADELARLLGLRQGHIEIHCHQGSTTAIDRIDKSLKRRENALDKRLQARHAIRQ